MSGSQPGDQTRTRWPDETADPWRTDVPRPEARGPLRILMVEDEPYDAKLEQRFLKQAGLDFTAVVVDTTEDFVRQLDAFRPDINPFRLRTFRPGRPQDHPGPVPQLPFVFLSGCSATKRRSSSSSRGRRIMC